MRHSNLGVGLALLPLFFGLKAHSSKFSSPEEQADYNDWANQARLEGTKSESQVDFEDCRKTVEFPSALPADPSLRRRAQLKRYWNARPRHIRALLDEGSLSARGLSAFRLKIFPQKGGDSNQAVNLLIDFEAKLKGARDKVDFVISSKLFGQEEYGLVLHLFLVAGSIRNSSSMNTSQLAAIVSLKTLREHPNFADLFE